MLTHTTQDEYRKKIIAQRTALAAENAAKMLSMEVPENADAALRQRMYANKSAAADRLCSMGWQPPPMTDDEKRQIRVDNGSIRGSVPTQLMGVHAQRNRDPAGEIIAARMATSASKRRPQPKS